MEQWFLPAAELTLTEAYEASSGYLEEEKHMGGSMWLFDGGLTLGGARDLFCEAPGHGRVSLTRSLGTYFNWVTLRGRGVR